MKNINIFNSFTLKIIAMVTMAIDHLGLVFFNTWNTPELYYTCRYIGRIAMPLYCFMLVEAVIHTRNFKNYTAKLGVMAVLISTFLALAEYVPDLGFSSYAGFGNIFLDLFLGSLMIYCLNHKNNWFKLFIIIPLGIGVFSFLAKGIEHSGSCPDCGALTTFLWYPKFLRLQYDWLSLGLMLGFYLAYKATDLFYKIRKEEYNLPEEDDSSNEYRLIANGFAIGALVLFAALYYAMKYIRGDFVWWDLNMQLFMIVVAPLLFLYSGKRGYSSTWFKWMEYLYYPVHILLIYGIYYLIYLL